MNVNKEAILTLMQDSYNQGATDALNSLIESTQTLIDQGRKDKITLPQIIELAEDMKKLIIKNNVKDQNNE